MRTSFLPLLSDFMGSVFTLPDDYRWQERTSDGLTVRMPGMETVEAEFTPRSKDGILYDCITLKGKNKEGKVVDYEHYYFDSQGVDIDKIEVEYRRGIITVKLPGTEKKKPEKKLLIVKIEE